MVLNKRSVEESLRKDIKHHHQQQQQSSTASIGGTVAPSSLVNKTSISKKKSNPTATPTTTTSSNNNNANSKQRITTSSTVSHQPKKTLKKNHKSNNKKNFSHNRTAVVSIGVFMFVYYLAMMYVRYQHRGIIGFADSLWLCNLAVILGFTSIFVDRPFLLGVSLNATLIVHALWVVDVISYFTVGVFPIGNAEYISWPNITWGEIITSTHHAWFVPLSIICLHRNGGYPRKGWVGSMALTIPIIWLSKLFPRVLVLDNGEQFYLNINQSHEWWEDMEGWPWNLIPKEKNEYFLFLICFAGVLFTVTHAFMKLLCYVVIKKN